jgi:hypothetical protein
MKITAIKNLKDNSMIEFYHGNFLMMVTHVDSFFGSEEIYKALFELESEVQLKLELDE